MQIASILEFELWSLITLPTMMTIILNTRKLYTSITVGVTRMRLNTTSNCFRDSSFWGFATSCIKVPRYSKRKIEFKVVLLVDYFSPTARELRMLYYFIYSYAEKTWIYAFIMAICVKGTQISSTKIGILLADSLFHADNHSSSQTSKKKLTSTISFLKNLIMYLQSREIFEMHIFF